MNKNLKGSAFLLSAALVWGLAFVAQKGAAGSVGVFSFTCLRSIVTCAVLAPVCVWRAHRHPVGKSFAAHLPLGLVMGFFTFCAISFQQWGLVYTTASKSGFITALYILIVPILGYLFMKKRSGAAVILGVILALAGTALLSLDFSEGFSMGRGELLTLGCSLMFSFHILYVDTHAEGYDPVLLCAMQFGVCFVVGLVGMLAFESISLDLIRGSLVNILYVGGISGAVGYTFQIVGQKYAEPTLASILMCMESVFGALGGALIGGELLTGLEYLGCALLLTGCIISQIPSRNRT